jgi:gamma-glutamyltranspeptidase/glutathione hydrolase
MVLLGILDLEQGRQPQSWVSLPRFHHQFVPDVVQYEPHAFSQAAVEALEAMGHRLQALDSRYGNMQAIYWDTRNNRVAGASDPRGIGTAQVQ